MINLPEWNRLTVHEMRAGADAVWFVVRYKVDPTH
jgi:hypothetical protein